MKIAIILLATVLAAHAGIIRLSSVVEKEGQGITRHQLGVGENTQILFVEDKAIITEADVANATPSLTRKDAVDVTLSKEGTEKMIAATKIMRPGIDRIAIIVDGKVLSAPVLQSVPLGKNFEINGLYEENEARNLADRLSGKIEG